MNITNASIADIKQRCFAIIERFPVEQLVNVAVSLEAMYRMIDDAVDDAYCLELYRSSFDEDNDEPMAFEQFAKGLGLETK